jgi:hypothetical protein
MSGTNRLIFIVAINLTVVAYCAFFYKTSHSIGRTFVLLAVSVVIANVAAELPRRIKKK